jgi:hypothetical protein
MTSEIVTADLSEFGHIELDEAIKLLIAYNEGRFKEDDFFSNGLTLNFNKNSGYVFLSDEDYNTGLLNNGVIEQFISCGYCGSEGFKSEVKFCVEGYCELCHKDQCKGSEHADEIRGVIEEVLK